VFKKFLITVVALAALILPSAALADGDRRAENARTGGEHRKVSEGRG